MTLLVGAWTVGLILSLLALGVFISFRVFKFPDITTEGSITLGAATAAVLLVHGVPTPLATLSGFAAGALAGTVTGVLHTKFNINGLLSGIIVMTALYSVDLRIMGQSNIPLINVPTLATDAERLGQALFGVESLALWGWTLGVRDALTLAASLAIVVVTGGMLYLFLRTHLGTAMRATGDNDQMMRALGVNVGNMLILGLALANGLVGLSGALLVQYQGFADVQMGIGMVVWGLASVIIGEALVGTQQLGYVIIGAVMGSVLFRLLVAVALRAGLSPNDLKLITAAFVFAALVLPNALARLRRHAVEQHA
ncbi:MAG: ABC transporter permease [Deltaproteobacteria bacterium]|nr:ABC transporter permease [Deltaproteobacteria bacterium]MBI3390683.1 ABC transporter permease [Deltaproteobacteria bacterium]